MGNVFNKPPRQNAPTDRVQTSVILKGIEWAFRKVSLTKINGLVHQGLLAPQSLIGFFPLKPANNNSKKNSPIIIIGSYAKYVILLKYRNYYFCLIIIN